MDADSEVSGSARTGADWLLHAWHAARDHGASDLHLASGAPPCLRITGVLAATALPPCPPLPWGTLASLLPEAATLLAGATMAEAEGALAHPALGRARWSLARHQDGLLLVLRLLADALPTPDSVQLEAAHSALVLRPHGLLLVTGATGAGKSSTLAALVGHWRAHHDGHVLTLEDPVELRYPPGRGRVTQREVGRDCISYADGLRAALRQDPDVILIGEIRDEDSARLALTAAETGHLVLSTLHAASAAGAIERYCGLFAGPAQALARLQLADSLVAIMAQTLETGPRGRQACREVLVATPAVRHLIREHRLGQLDHVMQTGAGHGMRTRAQALAALACEPGQE